MPRHSVRGRADIPLPRARGARSWARRFLPLVVLGLVLNFVPSQAPSRSDEGIGSHSRRSALEPAALDSPIWVGNYDTGTLAQFKSTPWNDQPIAPTVTKATAVDGHYAGSYTITAHGHRCENVADIPPFSEGDDMWFSWATQLGSGFPLDTNHCQVLDQWKNDGTGSPPIELSVSSGQFSLDGGFGWPGNSYSRPKHDSRSLGVASIGTWDRWTLHVKFSSDASVGYVDLWRNGRLAIRNWHLPGGTLYPHLHSYFKVGYYRDPGIGVPATVSQDRIMVGRTAGAVA